MPAPLRLGIVPYLNALPLVAGLGEDRTLALSRAVPSALVAELRGGRLDAALVSAVELFRDPPLAWIAGPAITSAGPVRSILLYLRARPQAARSLALDTASQSGAALARVCLAEFCGARIERVLDAPPDAPLETLDADAVLRIGDPALATAPGARDVLDLGALWTERTGLPFVYALWLLADAAPAARLAGRLRAARDAGRARRDELAAGFAAAHGLDAHACRDYLARCIGYEAGAREIEGLREFGRLAHRHGLVDRAALHEPVA